jgi:hypothetical protein
MLTRCIEEMAKSCVTKSMPVRWDVEAAFTAALRLSMLMQTFDPAGMHMCRPKGGMWAGGGQGGHDVEKGPHECECPTPAPMKRSDEVMTL